MRQAGLPRQSVCDEERVGANDRLHHTICDPATVSKEWRASDWPRCDRRGRPNRSGAHLLPVRRRPTLTHLRQRVQRFASVGKTLQALFSAHVEKALTFLDDRLLPATSNAVEQGNRRYRKMQKTLYRARTQAQIVGRLALDLFRDMSASARASIMLRLNLSRIAPAGGATR